MTKHGWHERPSEAHDALSRYIQSLFCVNFDKQLLVRSLFFNSNMYGKHSLNLFFSGTKKLLALGLGM